MTETRWWRYIQRLTDGDTAQEAARRAGFDKSAFTRWKKGARADPDFVVKIARAYGANVLEALVEAEFITEEEAALHEVQPTPREVLADVRDSLIAQELLTRVLTYEIRDGKAVRGAGITGEGTIPEPTFGLYVAADYDDLPAAARTAELSEGRQSALDADGRGEESQDPDDHA